MTYFKNIKTTKINIGIYNIQREGRTFQARKNETHGEWEIFELIAEANNGEDYMDTYINLKSCKILVNDYFNEL